MHSRRKILLFHGLTENKDEDVAKVIFKVVTERLKLSNFTTDCIRRCQRMGRPDSKKQRPILVKFDDVAMKNNIWFAKTNLKASGITISEFLTKMRHDLFLSARRKFGINKSWTRDGCVYVVASDGSRHRVILLGDLNKIPQPETVKPSTAKAAHVPKSKRR